MTENTIEKNCPDYEIYCGMRREMWDEIVPILNKYLKNVRFSDLSVPMWLGLSLSWLSMQVQCRLFEMLKATGESDEQIKRTAKTLMEDTVDVFLENYVPPEANTEQKHQETAP